MIIDDVILRVIPEHRRVQIRMTCTFRGLPPFDRRPKIPTHEDPDLMLPLPRQLRGRIRKGHHRVSLELVQFGAVWAHMLGRRLVASLPSEI